MDRVVYSLHLNAAIIVIVDDSKAFSMQKEINI